MSIITSTAAQVIAADAAANLALDLKMPGAHRDWDIPDQQDWKRADMDQRCLWIGGWMMAAASSEADRMNGPPVPFMPIGGEKYRHQND